MQAPIVDISEMAHEQGIDVPTFAAAEFLVHRSREDIEHILWIVTIDRVMLGTSPYRIHLSISSWRADGTSRSAFVTRERVGGVWTLTIFMLRPRPGKAPAKAEG